MPDREPATAGAAIADLHRRSGSWRRLRGRSAAGASARDLGRRPVAFDGKHVDDAAWVGGERQRDQNRRLPEESFDFLGYTVGRFHGSGGRAHIGTRRRNGAFGVIRVPLARRPLVDAATLTRGRSSRSTTSSTETPSDESVAGCYGDRDARAPSPAHLSRSNPCLSAKDTSPLRSERAPEVWQWALDPQLSGDIAQ